MNTTRFTRTAAAVTSLFLLSGALPAHAAQPSPSAESECSVHGRGRGPAGPASGSAHDRIERVISSAKSMTGKGLSYSWGAGGKGGPSCGIAESSPGGHHDYNVYGFDCSGFTLYAFWKGAGIDVGDTAAGQYGKGTKVPRGRMKRGDLIFWKADSGRVVHVALYLGGDQIIEAAPPRGTNSVHVEPLRAAVTHIIERDVITDHAVRFIS